MNSLNSGNPVRASSQIKQQLSDLQRVILQAEAYGEMDFASRIGLASLKRHKSELEAELDEANNISNGSVETSIAV